MFDRNEYMREYKRKNAEKIRRQAKEYHNANKEKMQTRAKRYYDANKETISEKRKEYRAKNLEHCKAQSRRIMWKYSGVPTPTRPHPLLCESCGEPETAKFNGTVLSLAVDHCHKSGEFRGYLCRRCNLVLGHMKDSTELLKCLISYVARYESRLKEAA